MGQQDNFKINPELTAAMQKQAAQIAKCGASVNEIMSAADAVRQTFLDIYAKEALKLLKTVKP